MSALAEKWSHPCDFRDRFWRDGYVTVPLAALVEARPAIAQDIMAVFRRAGADIPLDADLETPETSAALGALFKGDFKAYHGAARLANHLISVHSFGACPDIQDTLRALGLSQPTICARPLVWFHAPFLAKTTRYHRLPAHQEWSNMQGSYDGCVVWAPLVDVTPEMGRLQVVPGSHARGLLPFSEDAANDYPLRTDDHALSEETFTEVYVPPGEVLLFSAFLVHRSGVNRSDRARITVNFRFNNADDPGFVADHFLNPFTYAAPEDLKTERHPTRSDLQGLIQHRLTGTDDG